MKQMSYEEWLKFYNIEEEFEDCEYCEGSGLTPCGNCEGDGEIICECCNEPRTCPECDGDGEYDCPECDGRGEINITIREYQKRIKKDNDTLKNSK